MKSRRVFPHCIFPRCGPVLVILAVLAGCSSDDSTTSPEPPPIDHVLPPEPQVLVVNSQSSTLSRLDLETGEVIVNAAVVGTWANRIIPVPRIRELLLIASGDNEVQFLAENTLAISGSVDVGPGNNPWTASVFRGTKALVTNWLSGNVIEVDLATKEIGRSFVSFASGPEGILTTSNRAYIACTNFNGTSQDYGEGWLDVFDLEQWKRIASIPVGRNPQDVIEAPDGRIHVLSTGTYGQGASPEEGKITVVDPVLLEAVETVDIGGSPGRVAIASGDIAWVAGFEGGVRRYDARSLHILAPPVSPDLAAPGFSAVAWDSAGSTVYVASFEADLLIAIDEISGGTVRDAWIVGDGPVDVLVLR